MAINFVFRVCLPIELILTLSGCAIFSVMDTLLLAGSLPIGGVPRDTMSPPKILCANEASIGVGYYFEVYTDNEVIQRNESMRLISEHCSRKFIESKRVSLEGNWHGIFAICLQADGSPSASQPCEYDPAETVGFGQSDVTIPDG